MKSNVIKLYWMGLMILAAVGCGNVYQQSNGSGKGISPSADDRESFLQVAPNNILFSSSGLKGGPFSPDSKVISIGNTRMKPVNWKVTHSASWVTISKMAGTLPGNAKENVTFSINAQANTLNPGLYTDKIIFYQDVGNRTYNRTIKLTVNGGDICGNNIAGPTEICDGTDLSGQTCQSLGFDTGTLACLSDCSGFDTSNCENIQPACTRSPLGWINAPLSPQNGAFEVTFSATPGVVPMDGLVGFSAVAGSAFTNYAVIVRFNVNGTIDAINGAGYAAKLPIPYLANEQYEFRLRVDMQSHSFDAFVKNKEGLEQQVADGYAFRSTQASVSQIANYGVYADQDGLNVCDMNVAPISSVCGNNIAEIGEACDGADLKGESCQSQGFAGGVLLCQSDCDGFVTTQCTAPFSASAGPDLSTVPNGSVALLGSVTGGVAPYTYSWSPSADLSNAAVLQPIATPAQTTTYTLAVTDNTGAVAQDSVTVVVQAGPMVIPIGRWDMIPLQRIDPNGTLNLGVVAFSKNGISKVSFNIISSKYTGTNPLEAASMTLNPQTNVYEYWKPLSAADFSGDEIITVEATIMGADGGIRNKTTGGGGIGLDPLKIVVNAKGTLPHVEAWVSSASDVSDSDGVVGDSTKPFATLGGAIGKIREYRNSNKMGDNVDGAIVHLFPGTHTVNSGGYDEVMPAEEWLTVTTAAGGNADNTILVRSGNTPNVRKYHFKGITFLNDKVIGLPYPDRMQTMIWIDGCKLIGAGREYTWAHPLPVEWQKLYYTDTYITEVTQATTGSEICRGMTIKNIGDDAFQNIPMVINAVVDGIYPSNGAHADLWQHESGNSQNKRDENVIVYNMRATNLMYQSLFIRADIYTAPSKAQGMAFVNIYMDMLPNSAGWAGWGRWVDHLLWWNLTFRTKGMGFMGDSYAGSEKMPCKISNFSAKGNDFAELLYTGSVEMDWSGWDYNHFVYGEGMGTHQFSGNDYLDSFGVPTASSPLLDKIAPMAPADAQNHLRLGLADIGAYEK